MLLIKNTDNTPLQHLNFSALLPTHDQQEYQLNRQLTCNNRCHESLFILALLQIVSTPQLTKVGVTVVMRMMSSHLLMSKLLMTILMSLGTILMLLESQALMTPSMDLLWVVCQS